ncbi:MAG: hypothetical protein IJZ96_00715 [Lachnospiraceae bacterium]|nr:hypothetical protein [Lachnospiraceae bacterium]
MYECMLLGFKEGVGKTSGKPYWQIFVVAECSTYDNQYGRFGLKEETHFVEEAVFKKLTSNMVGKMVELEWSGFGKYASIKDIKLAK